MASNNNNVTNSLEEEALKRQERLKNLKRKFDKTDESSPHNNKSAVTELPKPKFRSYKPNHQDLAKHVLPNIAPSDVKDEVKDLMELAKSEVVIDELDISTLTPKQPDWDLKRDIAKKLEVLERRTQKAMAELIWEKLKEKRDLAELAK